MGATPTPAAPSPTARWLPAALFVALLALAVAPVWLLPIFPSQDGPSHVYAARALRGVLEGTPPYRLYYDAALAPVPNWLGSILLAAFGWLLPLRVAERLLLTLSIVVFSLGVRRLTARDTHTTAPAALLGPALSYGITLHYGFHSYGLGLALVPWAWSAATRHTTPARVAAATLGVLAWLCHLVPALLVVLGLVVIGISSALTTRDRRPLVSALVAALPSAALCLAWIAQSPPSQTTRWPLSTLLESLMSLRSLASYVGPSEYAAMAVGLVTIGLVLHARSAWRGAPWPWLALACTAAYVALPDGGADFWFLTDRLGLYPWLALLPVAGLARGHTATIVTAIAAAAVLGFDTRESWRLQPALADTDALAVSVPARATVMTLDFSPINSPARFRPWLHLSGYGAADAGAIDASSHEARTTHFQLQLRSNVGFPDPSRLVGRAEELDFRRLSRTVRYLVTVGADAAQEARLRLGYERIRGLGHSALWQATR